MRGYTTNFVNLIADNLRDRYDSGFPILKELIQNADDAKAHTFVFGSHSGFSNASHPLLRGSGLWFFNDGEFKTKDVEDLRSFGFNSKAGDAGAIGKFGLGMKSVFHLCEAMFYVAWDGETHHREGLTPWKQDDHTPHPEWDRTGDADWNHLIELGRELATRESRSWFLLWIPLRAKSHLLTPSGQESGSITSVYPGDDPSRELGFLRDAKLAHDVAEVLPLLRHLKRVEHKREDNRFVLQIELVDDSRLMGEPRRRTTQGHVLTEDGKPLLTFAGRRIQDSDADGWFAKTKAREEWPRTRYRNELGHEQVEDKTEAEAAVLFISGPASVTRSRLQWAVHLPVEDGNEDFEIEVDRSERSHSLILHGQFFLDAGRKKIHELEHLHEEVPDLPVDTPIDESRLRRAWNQRLAQDLLLPMVLPTLDDHVGHHDLSDAECFELAGAMSKSGWFKSFRQHVCRDGDWLRTLQPATHGSAGRKTRAMGARCGLRGDPAGCPRIPYRRRTR